MYYLKWIISSILDYALKIGIDQSEIFTPFVLIVRTLNIQSNTGLIITQKLHTRLEINFFIIKIIRLNASIFFF